MSLEAASIAQHCKSLRLPPSAHSLHRWQTKPASKTTRICITWKPCSRPRWRIENGARLNCE